MYFTIEDATDRGITEGLALGRYTVAGPVQLVPRALGYAYPSFDDAATVCLNYTREHGASLKVVQHA